MADKIDWSSFEVVDESPKVDWDSFEVVSEKEEEQSAFRRVGDVGISALKGAIGIPEAAIGLADLVTGGRAGKAAEWAGFRPREAREFVDELLSKKQQAANREVSESEGFMDTAAAALRNPSTIGHAAVEALPSMAAGGLIGRGIAGVTKVAPYIAGAIGEGVIGAGTAAERIRQQSDDGELTAGQAGAALASGVGTAAFGAAGGRIAQKLGVTDIDTVLASGASGVTSKGVMRRIVEGGIAEGVFEELPQSIQEQVWQNAALDKPLMDGVPEGAAMGLLTGAAMGGAAGGALGGRPDAPEVAPDAQAETLMLENKPDPFISFPDGTVGRQSEVDSYIASLPEDQQLAARARLLGIGEPAAKPEVADIQQAETVDDAIMAAAAVVDAPAEIDIDLKNQQIDQAFAAHVAGIRQQEFNLAEQARRDADYQAALTQAREQAVEQAEAITQAQGFDTQEPTAMQLAMQRAQQRQQVAEVPVEQPSMAAEPVTAAQPEPAMAAPADLVDQARNILTAAGVTGNERMAALRSIRTGENTLQDLIDAHPPKVENIENRPQIAQPSGQLRTAGAEVSAPVQPVAEAGRAPTAQVPAEREGLPSAERPVVSGGVAKPIQTQAARPAAIEPSTARAKPVAMPIEEVPATVPAGKVTRLEVPRQVAGWDLANRQAWQAQWASLKNRVREGLVTEADAARVKKIAIEKQADAPKELAKLVTEIKKRPVDGKPLRSTAAKPSGITAADIAEQRQQRVDETVERAQQAKADHDDAIRKSESPDYRDDHRAPGRENAAPLSDLTGEGNIYPDDVYSANGPRYYGTGADYDAQAFRLAKMAKGNPDFDVMIFRAVPSDVDAEINPGDWVSITRQYAVDHGESRFDGDYKILTKMVKAGDIFTNGDSIQEWGYDPEENTRESRAPRKRAGMTVSDANKATTNLRAKWLGFTKVNTVQSVADLPVDILERANADDKTEAIYDPQTKSVHLVADNIASPERAVWTAVHEVVGHGGLRMLKDKSLNDALNLAGANRFVRDLAQAIRKDRGDVSVEIAVEESIAELSAAIETNDFQALTDRYGVTVPEASRNGIRGVVARTYEAVRRFLATVMGKPVADVSDADVRDLIGQQREAVEGRITEASKSETEQAESETTEPTMASQAPEEGGIVEVDGETDPITDSRGKLVGQTEQDQAEFWRNYNGPVNEDGRPILPDPTEAIRYSTAPAGEERVPKWAEGLTETQKAALRKSGAIYTEQTMKKKVAELKEGALKKLQYGILDQFAPIKDKVGKIPYILARMAKNADGTLEALMLYGRPHLDSEGGMLVDTTKKGFVETMQALNGEHERFFSWLAGRRAEQLKKEGRENLFTDEDISALATLNQGKMKDGTSREAAYLKAQKDVAELNKSVLDIAESSGLIDGESRKVWASDFYVPFYRVMEEGVTGPSIKSGLVNQKTIKKLKGGTSNLGDLTQNMLMNWSTLLTASAKNRAAKATLDAATEMGIATEAPESTIRQMGKAANTKAISYLENGVPRWHVVEDDHLLAAISALEFSGYNNQAVKVMQWFKNTLTKLITVSPYFKVRNLIRDSLSVLAVSDINRNPLVNLKNGYSLLRDDDARAQLVAGGGVYRFGMTMEGNRAENVKRLIDSGIPDETILNTAEKMQNFISKLWRSYEELGDLSENINRAALYKKLREEGKSHLEASFEARDLMDFGLSGAWAGVRALNQILPFFQARIQGLRKLGIGYNDDPKRMGYVIGALALATIALSAAYKDDDDFKKRSDSDRNNYWWFKVGGIAYRIPRPFEIGAAATAIDNFSALFYDSENTNADRFATQMGELINSQLAMNPIPQVFRPVIDVYANKDAFSGRPIESQALQRLRPEDRYTHNTSELARLLSKSGVLVDPVSLVAGTGVKQLSPVQIDALIKGYFAGAGALAVSGADGLLHHTLIDRGSALPVPLRTLTGSFAEELPTNSSRYVDMLYKTAQDVEQTYASYRSALNQGDLEKARKIAKEEGATLAKYHMIESLKKNESRISQAIQRTINDKVLTGEQKEEAIRRLKAVQDRIARQLVTE